MDLDTADHLLETMNAIISWTIKKKEFGVDVRMVQEYLPDLLEFLLRCQTAYITYKLLKKDDPEHIKKQIIRTDNLIKDLSKISTDSEKDYFDSQVVRIVDEAYGELHDLFIQDQIADAKWRTERAEELRIQLEKDIKEREIKFEERR